jgi:hypothetical protein
MRRWETKHFVLAGMLSALTFAVAFVLGAGIILATGIPATGGIANIFVAVLILIIGVKLVPKFGFGILTLGLVFTFAIPTIIGGPPGIYKVINGLLIGATLDIVLMFGRYSRTSHIIGGALGAMLSILSIYAALVLLNLPGAAKLAPLVLPLAVFQALMGSLAAWVGLLIFDRRLIKLEAVKRIMSSSAMPS